MNRKLKAKIIELFGTQTEFAKAVGEQESVISRIINGHETINAERAEKWAEILGCDLLQLQETLKL